MIVAVVLPMGLNQLQEPLAAILAGLQAADEYVRQRWLPRR